MTKFQASENFIDSPNYKLLPFRFSKFKADYLISNDFGEWIIISKRELHELIEKKIAPESSLYRELKLNNFIVGASGSLGSDILASKLKTKKEFIIDFSKLHIFCMTLRCNHSCIYCQVSRKSEDACNKKFDMNDEVLSKSIDLMLQVPSPSVTMEFQGGESLLAIEQVKKAVLLAKKKNELVGKDITFVICTNMSGVTKETLLFFKEHNIHISTSLDGPSFLHNMNRNTSGGDSYEKVIKGFNDAKVILGNDCLSALMTTTKESLKYPKEIVDEYIRNGFSNIFIRELNPYGFAEKAAKHIGYTSEQFVDFYKRILDYIIQINHAGIYFQESFAGLILKKLLTPWPIGFVDLQSPTGTGFNVTLYNYDGKVYPSDESRMLSETGDNTFCLGDVLTDDYEKLFFSEPMQLIATASTNESLPSCSDCAYAPFCGSEPVRRHQTQQDIFGHRPTDTYCIKNKAIIQHIIDLWVNGSDKTKSILSSWINN
ncbi:His-Xaa-Ser system radical SAM maturase HxsB [Photobacterium damselae]|uniref:His-Xaa-Ser system radical SAM maturase HxsB n=1 Tax=Photobacterium damselae TaxID=38293 RepID=UPI0040693174